MSRIGSQTMDKERVSFNLARLRKGGKKFEVAIDADKAIEFKKGNSVDIQDVVKSDKIFADVKKGLLAEETSLNELFKTADTLAIAKTIVQEGEIQFTEEYRRKLREEKRNRLVTIICRNAIDPKTKLPHPPQRIENALDEARITLDDFKSAEEQLDDVMKKLQPILPIKIAIKKIEVTIPATYAAKAYSAIAPFGKPQKEAWNNDGSYTCTVDIPAGLEADFYDKLNSLTHGGLQAKVLED